MISLRQIPPLSLGSESDQVMFGALTDGQALVVFPVMRAHADLVTAAAIAKSKGEGIEHGSLSEASSVAMLDTHAMVYAMKPQGIIVELRDGLTCPNMIVGTELAGEFIPISPSTMAVLAAVWSISVVAVPEEFSSFAVPVPQGDEAVEWSRAALSRVYAQMISTRFQGIEFDTDVPEHLAIRLGLRDGITE